MPPPPPATTTLEEDLSHLSGHGAGTSFLLSMRSHPTLSPFLRPDFDAAAFSAQVVAADGAIGNGSDSGSSSSARSRAEVMVAQLTEQLGQAELAIEKHVLQHQRQLMQGMGDLGELRENCNVLTVRSKELRRSVNKLSAELLEPYQGTERRTQQLRRLHEANDLLKKVARFSATLARLKKDSAHSSSSSSSGSNSSENRDPATAIKGLELRELAKAAQHLHEVETLFQDPNLGGLNLFAAERPYVTALGQSLRQTAKDSLKLALQSMNQADLGPALQVFYNLDCLAPVVLECLAGVVAEAAEATARAFDAATLERMASAAAADARGGGGSSSSWSSSPTGASASGRGEIEAIALRQRRARFREHCDQWATVLYQCAVKVWHLQRVLHKKVDATSNEGFLDVVLRSPDFRKALERATAASPSSSSSSTNDGLKRGHSRGGSLGSSHHTMGASSPSSVGALYWVFWLDFTGAIRKVAEAASKRAGGSSSSSTSGPTAVVRCYPYFLLAVADVLNRLLDNSSKLKAGGGGMGSASSSGGGAGQQGNPAALLALMEALGVDNNTHPGAAAEMGMIGGEEQQQQQQQRMGPSSGLGGPFVRLPEVAAGSAEERTALVDALASLRDLYLGESLQTLCRPIEQMFPTVEGYQAAVPSKHDLQALFKVMQAELVGGLAEGGPLLLPHLVRGVVKAVHLFCTKVEAMTNTSEGARKLYALRGWILGPEKEHNLQLLQLVAFLHQGLQRLPQDLAKASVEFVGGAVGAGALGDQELVEAAAALEALAVANFVHPYMVDIAAELGGILSEMHLENYAPQGRLAEQQGADGPGSRFIATFQEAVAALRKHHLSRFPVQAAFVGRAFKWLAGRLLRVYVSHAALVRPLNEAGKTKLNNDMAMLETALTSIHPKLSELGAPYLELKAFRQLCFFGDDQNPFTVNGLAKERFTVHLRPSTLLDALFARAPLELSSPHVLQRCSERTLVEELLALYYEDRPQAHAEEEGEGGGGPRGGAAGKKTDPRVRAEMAHWQVVQVCLDAYAQRMSASQSELAYIYDVMLNLGGLLLKGFGERLAKEKAPQEGGGGGGVAAKVLRLNW